MSAKAVGDVAEMSSPPTTVKLSAAELIAALQNNDKDGIIITRRTNILSTMEPKILSFDSRVETTATTMGSPTTITIHPLPPTPPKPKSRTPPLKNPNEVDWRSKSQRDHLRQVGKSYLSKKAAADVTTIKSDPPLRPTLMNQAASVSGRRTDHEAYHLDEAAKQSEEAAASVDMIRSTAGSGVGIPVHKKLLSSKNVQRNQLQQQTNRQPIEAKVSTAMKEVSCVPPQRKGIVLKDVTNSMRNDNISQKRASVPGKTNTKLKQKALATVASRRSNSKSQEKTQPEADKDLNSTPTSDVDDFESSIRELQLDTHVFKYDNTPDSSFDTDVAMFMFIRGKHTFTYDSAHTDSSSKSESDCSSHDNDSDCSSYNTEAESCFYTESSYGVSTLVKSTSSTPQTKNTGRNHDHDDDKDDFVAEPIFNMFSPVHNIRMERDKATGSDHRKNNVSRSRSFFACFDFDEIRLALSMQN